MLRINWVSILVPLGTVFQNPVTYNNLVSLKKEFGKTVEKIGATDQISCFVLTSSGIHYLAAFYRLQ